MPLPSLPTETIENVIDQATFDTQTLRGFALSCRDLLPRSRYHLFHSIRFRDKTQLYSFYRFLDLHPHVAPFVISLTLSATRNNPTSQWLLQIIPTRLFKTLFNMCTWKITDRVLNRKPLFFSSPTLACLKAHGTAIVELHLDHVLLQNCARFAEYILAFRGLKILHCRDVRFKTDLDDLRLSRVKERLAKQLRLSTLIIGDRVRDDAAGALLQSSFSTLLHLELRVWDSKLDIPTIVSELHGLRSLTLVLNGETGWSYYVTGGEVADSVLRAFHIIKELCLHPQSRLHTLTVHCPRILLFLDPLFNPDSYPDLECCRELEAVLLHLSSLRNIQVQVQYDVQHGFDLMPLLEQYLPTLARQRSVTVKRLCPSSHRQQANHDSFVTAISVSPDSQWIASGSRDGTIILWDSQRRSIIHEWIADSGWVISLAFSPDSRHLASGGLDGEVVVWDISGPRVKKVATLEGHSSIVQSCTWSPDGTTLVSGSDDETVRIWDSRTYQQRNLLRHPSGDWVDFVRFSPDGRWIVSGGESTSCAVWDAATGDLRVALSGHSQGLRNAVFDLATGRIATASSDHTVRIWDIETGPEALVVLEGHTDEVRDVAFSPDGRHMVSGSRDGTVKVWDSFSGELLLSLEVHISVVTVVCFSPDGKYIASASGNGTVRLWRASDGVCIRTLIEHTDQVTFLVYSPDGETLTSGGLDGMVCIRRVCDIIPDSECSEADGLIM